MGHRGDVTSTRSIEIDACKRQSPPLRTAKDFLPHMVDEAPELYGGGPGPSKASTDGRKILTGLPQMPLKQHERLNSTLAADAWPDKKRLYRRAAAPHGPAVDGGLKPNPSSEDD